MRSPIFIAILALATVAVGIGTSAAPQQSPATFRSTVTLVGVDVTVLDKDGRPVAGLTADDFHIRLNGALRPVRTVSYEQVTQVSDADVALAAAVAPTGGHTIVTNVAPVNDPKIFVLAIDDLSLPADGGRRTLTAARKFVDSQPSSVLVGVTTTSGAVAVNPTHDRSVVSAALSRVTGTFIDPRRPQSMEAPSIGITEALEIAGYNNTSVRNSAIERAGSFPNITALSDAGQSSSSIITSRSWHMKARRRNHRLRRGARATGQEAVNGHGLAEYVS